MTNPCTTWDFTLHVEDNERVNDVIEWMNEYCKKWCFQLEECPTTKKKHYQGRMVLGTKRRRNTLVALMKDTVLQGAHLSVTSVECRNGMFYVMKPESRILGPWKNEEEKEKVYIPRHVREIVNLRPWQQRIVELAKEYDTRSIYIIYDPSGNVGKSSLSAYMDCHGLATEIPPCNDHKDIMRMVMDMPTSTAYVIDMPRALKKDKLYQMWSGIETIKTGYAYDDRYSFKRKRFDIPQIFVFTNIQPDMGLLSGDRWRICHITPDNMLAVFDKEGRRIE